MSYSIDIPYSLFHSSQFYKKSIWKQWEEELTLPLLLDEEYKYIHGAFKLLLLTSQANSCNYYVIYG